MLKCYYCITVSKDKYEKEQSRKQHQRSYLLPLCRCCVRFMKFQVVCDSSADLQKEEALKDNITVVPFYVSIDGENYLKEGVDISIPDFYKAMIDNPACFPKTSMPSVQDYIDCFTGFAKKGESVLCICLTEKFSGSYQSAVNAKMAVEEMYENAHIYVMDSMLVTALQGLFVKEAVRLRDLEISLEEAVPLLEEIRTSGQIFFTTDDLKYLQHGGRLGKAAFVAGSVLNLKPILHFCDGELAPAQVVRGRKKSLERVVDNFFNYLKTNNINLNGYWFGTGIGADIPQYDEFKETISKRFSDENIKPDSWIQVRIGSTIGVHTGPYPIGLGILKKCRV